MADIDRTQEFNIDNMVKTIPVVCSWCNKIYHIKKWSVDSGKETGVSHGMCPDCEKKQNEELEKMQADKEQEDNG